MRMHKVIKRILDEVLDMPLPTSSILQINTFHDPALFDLALFSILDLQDEPDFLE